jgi:hypothetical protein
VQRWDGVGFVLGDLTLRMETGDLHFLPFGLATSGMGFDFIIQIEKLYVYPCLLLAKFPFLVY